jgi:phage-related minor tail protein
MADDLSDIQAGAAGMSNAAERLAGLLRELQIGANGFSHALTGAFARGIADGKRLDDVLKSLALRFSDLALRSALRPLSDIVAGGLDKLLGGVFGALAKPSGLTMTGASGAIKPFAAGGVISTPTYFPLRPGGLGLAGEAGPEAIMPLARGPDGRLGVTAAGAAQTNITVNIATPDVESFRRSEAYVTGQIARAVGRGQRGL